MVVLGLVEVEDGLLVSLVVLLSSVREDDIDEG